MDLKQSNSEINAKKELIKLRKNIKRKVLALKLNETENDQTFMKTYDAIINPLQTIAKLKLIKSENSDKLKIKVDPRSNINNEYTKQSKSK